VTADEEQALKVIQDAVAADRVEVTTHFDQKIAERGMLWVDMLTIVDEPTRMEDQGIENHGWPKWRVWGKSADDTSAAVVVAIRDDGRIRFITIHWED
jgi:hypothetical protein